MPETTKQEAPHGWGLWDQETKAWFHFQNSVGTFPTPEAAEELAFWVGERYKPRPIPGPDEIAEVTRDRDTLRAALLEARPLGTPREGDWVRRILDPTSCAFRVERVDETHAYPPGSLAAVPLNELVFVMTNLSRRQLVDAD